MATKTRHAAKQSASSTPRQSTPQINSVCPAVINLCGLSFKARMPKGCLRETNSLMKHRCPRSETLKGLGWQANTDNTGMFFDDRVPKKQGVLVAWLNYRDTLYSVNVVHSAFKLTRPIPSTINTLGEAVEWVYNNSVWRPKPERRAE